MMIRFNKSVGKTIAEGRITVPQKYALDLDNAQYCAIGDSVNITYCLQNGVQINGRLYQSINNTTTYYQFYIPDQKDIEIFKDHIGSYGDLSIDFDLRTHCLYIFS